MAEKSYTSAVTDAPLLGDTIGENFDKTVARFADRVGTDRLVCREDSHTKVHGTILL